MSNYHCVTCGAELFEGVRVFQCPSCRQIEALEKHSKKMSEGLGFDRNPVASGPLPSGADLLTMVVTLIFIVIGYIYWFNYSSTFFIFKLFESFLGALLGAFVAMPIIYFIQKVKK